MAVNFLQICGERQTILITCRHKEKDNVMAIDWHMPSSFEPELYVIAIGKQRFSCDMIRNSRVFVANFVPFSLKEKVLFCGRHSGRFMDKLKEAKLTKEEAEKVDCPRIKEAVAYLECEVVNELETGDHIIFIGKILKSDFKKRDKRIFHISGDEFVTTEN
ncbi:flavin reductase family protein [Candidatus Woesearchaeota archaeon]|nr:flavin reductase family protein [Candidatus Woesearchaeota archaeon]